LTVWDPVTYLAFADHRARPFHDLVARIGAREPRRVVDLGCGPGNLTVTLGQRWPGAVIEGVDSSPDMIGSARKLGVSVRLGDVTRWRPSHDTDVVECNAVLHWVPSHADLLVSWARELPANAWLAMQIPGAAMAASHVAIREVASSPVWRSALVGVRLIAEDAALPPVRYADLLADVGCDVDAWETTYVQRLVGPDPVLDWVRGTTLRPIRAALDDGAWAAFTEELGARLRAEYPARADGTTWFEFRRVFVVARTPG
jgi:trans-aconitate 2-methyltransferase